jgi:hypothetical protein
MKKIKRSEFTNLLTKNAIYYLNMLGCSVARQNNIAAPGRKFIGELGLPDIGGCTPYGVSLYIEVKTGTDKLSENQIKFFRKKLAKGCLCFVIRTWSDLELVKKGIEEYGGFRKGKEIKTSEEIQKNAAKFCNELLKKEKEYNEFKKNQAKTKRQKKNAG